MKIPFNIPYSTRKGIEYINQAISSGHLSANGDFTEKCRILFRKKYGFRECLLTTSCTDALEMTAILLNIQPGDEVIVPTFTFVSTALAFYREGAKIVFAESREDHPGIDEDGIEKLITSKTKAIVVVHYAGVACDMIKIKKLAEKNNLVIIEDCAHSFDSYYMDKPLGTLGDLACFSFHETKNIHCGEGGMLIVNNDKYFERALNIKEKGTNRIMFEKGKAKYYEWTDTGSSFALSEINAAFLLSQVEKTDFIQSSRIETWNYYYNGLKELEEEGLLILPAIPRYASNNGNMFYIICRSETERDALIKFLASKGINAYFHYRCLHSSNLIVKTGDYPMNNLDSALKYQNRLLRLPFYTNMQQEICREILDNILTFYYV